MFLTRLFLGYCTLAVLGQDFGVLISNVVLSDGDVIKYDVHKEKKTWDDANIFCQNKGETLAYITTYEEHKNIIKYIKDNNLLPQDTTSGYWLGGKYLDNKWQWELTGIDTRDEEYFMAGWHWNEPNRRFRNGKKQDCMELKYIRGNVYTESLAWNDMWCDEKRGFICKSFDQPAVQ